MRKLIIIFLFSLPFSLVTQNYYVISDTTATNLKQYKITWFYGVDPVQLKSGEWVISEQSYKDIREKFIDKPVKLETAQKAAYVRQTVKLYPMQKILPVEWKVSEIEVTELIK